MKYFGILLTLLLAHPLLSKGAALTESTFTEVVREVNVLADQTRAARLNDLFRAPDRAQTGVDSRAELTAPDKTITRIGSTTVFSFRQNGQEVLLDKGSILFNSPPGRGKRTIRTAGASAGVLGTTMAVAATADGGFKVILLEGRGLVTLPNGRSRTLRAGQMVYILPGQPDFGPVLDIDLATLVAGSTLVNGFSQPLPSAGKIQQAIADQRRLIARGGSVPTGIEADQFVLSRKGVEDDVEQVDEVSQAIAVAPFRRFGPPKPPPPPPPRPPPPEEPPPNGTPR